MNVYILAYAAFLTLIAAFLTLNALVPRKKEVYKPTSYMPKTLVMIPCKGFDIGLKENLMAAKMQSYGNYEVVAIVASKGDTAFKSIRQTRTKFMVADLDCKDCSGKVRNIASALSKFKNYDAYVILDSDVLVGKDWLQLLVTPLANRKVGISTAFPFFEPVGRGFWQKVKHAWGFVGQGMMENSRTRFGWGGSLAFKKDLLSKMDFDYFSESVSDDIALTNIARRKGLGIAYVPEANPVVRSDEDFGRFIEWSNRQTTLSVAGSRKILYFGLIFYSLSILLLVSAALLGALVNTLFFLLLAPFAVGAVVLYLRSGGRSYMLGIYFIMNFIYLYNMIVASRTRTIEWRGRSYDITKIKNMQY
ncbi:MAG: glycosyltransferase family 2 protein [Candidatus Micrarchaeaceae archaeon]